MRAWGDRTFGQVREGNTRFADDAREASTWRTTTGRAMSRSSTSCGRTWASPSPISARGTAVSRCWTIRRDAGGLRSVLHHGAVDSRLPSSVSAQAVLRTLRHQPGEVRPGQQPPDPGVALRGDERGLRRRRCHHRRAVWAGRAGPGRRGHGRTVTDNCLVIDSPGAVRPAPGNAGTPAGAALATGGGCAAGLL